MTVKTEKQPILAALNHATGVVEKRNTMPILSHVLVEVGDGKMTFRATDLDVEVISAVECETNGEWSAVVPADMLKSALSKAKGEITLDYKDQRIWVNYGKSEFNFACLDVKDFPKLASDEFETTFKIDSGLFFTMFDKTAFAQSSDEARYFLCGVYLHSSNGNLTTVATTGHVLARYETEFKQEMTGVIVPSKTVKQFLTLEGGEFEVSSSETKIKVIAGDVTIVSKVIDGQFPPYTKVIPSNTDHTVIADNKAMKEAVARVVVVDNDKTKYVKFDIKQYGMTLSSKSNIGEAKDELPVDFDGGELVIGFNSRYLNDVYSHCGDGLVDIKVSRETDPALIIPQSDTAFNAVVMPMRVV